MTRSSTRTFRSGNSQAVRLPKEVAFAEETELTLVRSGDVLTIYPARGTVQDLVARLAELPKPSAVEVRDDEDLLERPGL
ncbi:AbrB/MazE/SpoVT family DNA-binding domain-containing protein [Caulobacter sp. 602-2]|uniref:AbrB/MazE/SpoVT family DNA-binding domain-containing protein n=1 Tax=Caulobacter sp. 602-2 TaxID=2710887 RepID=A0A6G4QWT1_9CAUL|nr:AbrB/MazE/SpoVT family DNA-binding domain-containing protein [Caulobacter sp. 602-2]NGM49943.1 AbrB/MazE/SpoVT family DNA-binding domain-containing protein [Caulobacter sp. 602-2]